MQNARSMKGKGSISDDWTPCLHSSTKDANQRSQPLINDIVLAAKPYFLYPLYTRLLAIVLTKRINRRIGTLKIGVRKPPKRLNL
jgi:hypothetical protein